MARRSPVRARSDSGHVSEAATSEGGLVELEVLRVAHGGVFVAREGEGTARERVVFVPDTAPGERILARITDVRRTWSRAEAIAVLRASPDRVPHIWASAGIDRAPDQRAGGAEFGHLTPDAQRALKGEVLRDALLRTGRLPDALVEALGIAVRQVPGEPDGTRSRTRVRVHADGAAVGPFAARTRRVVPVPDLPLGLRSLEALLGPAAAHGPGPVDLVAADDGPAFAAVPGARRAPVHQTVAGRSFAVEADGFWQVHPAAPEVLTAAVRAAVRGVLDPSAQNLDLYGGVGLLAAALAAEGGEATRVVTVEADRAASAHARDNLADLRGASAVHGSVDRFLAAERPGPGAAGAVVVLDPPRSGAGRRVVELVADRDPRRIVYVACDPVALARDAGVLLERGWRPVRIDALDLFPATHHLESVAVFDRD